MAAIQSPESTPNPASGGSAGAGGGGGSQSSAGSVGIGSSAADISLAENVAASLAALGYTNSPLRDTEQATISQTQQSNTMLILALILAAVIVAYLLTRKNIK